MPFPQELKLLVAGPDAEKFFKTEPVGYKMTQGESVGVLSRFLRCGLLTPDSVNYLGKMGCDFNVELQSGLKVGHELFGRLTPLLINALEQNGYHFKDSVDNMGRTPAFYLGGTYMPEVIAALKLYGVDFNRPALNGDTPIARIVKNVLEKPICAARLLGDDGLRDALYGGSEILRQSVTDAINKIPPKIDLTRRTDLLLCAYSGMSLGREHN